MSLGHQKSYCPHLSLLLPRFSPCHHISLGRYHKNFPSHRWAMGCGRARNLDFGKTLQYEEELRDHDHLKPAITFLCMTRSFSFSLGKLERLPMFLGISFVPFRPLLLFTPSLQWTQKESDEKNDSIRFPFINGGGKSSSFLNVYWKNTWYVILLCVYGVIWEPLCTIVLSTYIPNRSNTHWRQRVNFPFPWYSKQEKLSPAFRLHSAVYLEKKKIIFTFCRTDYYREVPLSTSFDGQ